jgi:solute carrier family 25 protein 39/40
MSVPATVIYYTGYESLRHKLSQWLFEGGHSQAEVFCPLVAGSTARILAATVISPLELLKTKVQHHGSLYGLSGVVRSLRHAVLRKGLGELYKGLSPTLWRDVPFSAIYWTGYELFRSYYNTLLIRNEHISSLDRFNTSFSAGASAGIIAAALTTPFDVAKTRRQVEMNSSWLGNKEGPRRGIYRLLGEIWRKEGWRGLTLGIGPRICKVAPSCAIMVGTYELGKSYLQSHRSLN